PAPSHPCEDSDCDRERARLGCRSRRFITTTSARDHRATALPVTRFQSLAEDAEPTDTGRVITAGFPACPTGKNQTSFYLTTSPLHARSAPRKINNTPDKF